MSFGQLAVDDFCARLGSGDPAPGGGSAAALMAGLAAALVQMVANHTAGRPKYAAVEQRMRAILADAEALGRRARELMDADAAAFQGVSAAFKVSRQDPGREAAVSAACVRATEVPLEVLRTCARVGELAAEVRRDGNRTLENDARAALLTARAAADISAGNVRANQPFIQDQAWAGAALAEAERILAALSQQAAA
jgi:formiminotetrahydrofolate cyclodeaminase